MKKFIVSMFGLLVFVGAHKVYGYGYEDDVVDGVYYRYFVGFNDEVKIAEVEIGTYALEELVVPSTLGGYTVTGFDRYVDWDGHGRIRSIVLPETIREIGSEGYWYSPFRNLSSLEKISMPGVTNIGERAFSECYNLSTVEFSEDLVNIGEHAFYRCTGLTNIVFPKRLKSIGDSAFSGAFESWRSGISLNFPEGLETIGEGAFGNCYGLGSIKMVYYPHEDDCRKHL